MEKTALSFHQLLTLLGLTHLQRGDRCLGRDKVFWESPWSIPCNVTVQLAGSRQFSKWNCESSQWYQQVLATASGGDTPTGRLSAIRLNRRSFDPLAIVGLNWHLLCIVHRLAGCSLYLRGRSQRPKCGRIKVNVGHGAVAYIT